MVNVYRKYFMLVFPAHACRSRSDLRLTLRLHAHIQSSRLEVSAIRHQTLR